MKKAFIGFDTGGTNIVAGTVSEQGQIFDLFSYPTEAKAGKAQVAKNTLKVLDSLLATDIECLGICLAWPSSTNMPLTLNEIKRVISKKYKYPLFFENDANLFTLAEALVGQGKKYKTVVGITIGTGVGCGLVNNKKIFNGRGEASEFGHVSLNFDGSKCVCGNYGCFEEYAGSRAIKRLAKKYKLSVSDGKSIYALAKQGDKKALRLWQEFGKHLGLGLISVTNAYDPDIIILGGQISKAYKFFIKSTKEEIKNKALLKIPVIKVSKLSNAAIAAAAFVNK